MKPGNEFDEKAARYFAQNEQVRLKKSINNHFTGAPFQVSSFIKGARWQHQQSQKRIEAMEKTLGDMESSLIQIKEYWNGGYESATDACEHNIEIANAGLAQLAEFKKRIGGE